MIFGNSAVNATGCCGDGGAIYLDDSSPVLNHVTIVNNSASTAGGIYLNTSSDPILNNCLLAYNAGLNLFSDNDSNQPILSYSYLYNPYAMNHNLDSLPDSITQGEPRFVAFSMDGNADNDDFHFRPSSPLINAGDPSACSSTDSSGCDPDGSLPDVGVFGGANADFSYYADADVDGCYDGWERAHSGALSALACNSDTDNDGLTDAKELDQGTNPTTADSDGDGFSDGEEVKDGHDPLNPFSVPGIDGFVVMEVPSEKYPTIQSAIDAIPGGMEGHVQLDAGPFNENVLISMKRVLVEGAGMDQTMLDGGDSGTVLTVDNAILELSGVTLTHGNGGDGGGASLRFAQGSFSDVRISENRVTEAYSNGGAGMFLYYSDPTLRNVTIADNRGEGTFSDGGGLWLVYSNPILTNVTIVDNWTEQTGGGMYLYQSNPVLIGVTLSGNSADDGGGMYLSASAPILTEVVLSENSASYDGGGMYLRNNSSPTMRNVSISSNVVSGSFGTGGGIYLYKSAPLISHSILSGNIAKGTCSYCGGGGMYMDSSGPVIHDTVIAYNVADKGGNLYRYTSEFSPSTVTVQNSLLYNPPGSAPDNITPTGDYLTVEPQFLSYADTSTGQSCSPGSSLTCVPDDLHPALGSPLINAGDSSALDVDGSRADIGIYGGPDGAGWDLDGDGYFDYFWPGEWADAPDGFDPEDYDCDDLDEAVPLVTACPG